VKPIKFVTLVQAKAIHEKQLALFGGTTSEKMLCNWLKENTET
jgi:hypothetical protein